MQRRRYRRALFGTAVFAAAFLLSVASAFAASPACEPGALATKYPSLVGKTIRLSVTSDGKPLSYRDPDNLDNVIGFSPDQARAAFACIGVPYTLTVAPFSGALAALIAGQVDIFWGTLFYTPERAKAVDIVTYMIGASGGVVPKGNPKNIRSLDDLCGMRGVAPVGGIEAAKLKDVSQACIDAHKPGLEVLTATDRPSALRLLDNDRVDLYLGIGLKQAYDPTLYTFAFAYANNLKTGVGVRKGDKDLDQAIADAFAVLHKNGTDAALFAKYEIDPGLSVPPEIIVQ